MSKMVDTSTAYADRLLPMAGTTTHSHGPEGEHEHGGWAFTTWLDPTLAIQQAQAVTDALASLRPENAEEIHARFGLLESDLSNLDGRFSVAAGVIGDVPLVFSHPVYQYLIHRYELNGVEVHWEPDEAPEGNAWDHLEELLESHPAQWMLWEGSPLEVTVAGLDELGVASVVFKPCGNRPESGDYLTVMAANAEATESIAR
jgi:zinc transport system substrate-binding protein